MILGEKLWDDKGKSSGSGLIKYVNLDNVDSEYTWIAQIKGLGEQKM